MSGAKEIEAASSTLEQEDSSPPPYSPGTDIPQDHTPDSRQNFDTIHDHIAAAKHSYEFQSEGDSLVIRKLMIGREALLGTRADRDAAANTTEVFLLKDDRPVAQARVGHGHKDFEIYAGRQVNPSEPEWIPVRCKSDGMLKPHSYHFHAGSKRLAWSQRNAFAIGSSKNDWKLEDESDIGRPASQHRFHGTAKKMVAGGMEIAAHHSKAKSSSAMNKTVASEGRVEWKDDFGDDLEMLALVTLIVILQRSGKNGK